MAAAPDRHPIGVLTDPCTITVAPARPGEHAAGEARSYLADGRLVRWRPSAPAGLRVAVDAELAEQPVPPALARRFGASEPSDFWTRWTRVEVCCKLLDIPVLEWLTTRGLDADVAEVALHTQALDGVVVTCGLLRGGG